MRALECEKICGVRGIRDTIACLCCIDFIELAAAECASGLAGAVVSSFCVPSFDRA
jgi:hypothetical protein